MNNSSTNRPMNVPAPFERLTCQAGEALYGGVECRKSRENGIKLCAYHATELAKAIGWQPKPRKPRNLWEERQLEQKLKTALQVRNDELSAEIADLKQEIRELHSMSPRERRKRKAAATEGTVYFLLSDNLVKIGWTSDLDRRMKEYSPGARILAVMPGKRSDETRLHRKFADLRGNRNEWFTYHPRIMEEVERVIAAHGEPPRDLNEPMVTKRIVGPRLDRPTQLRARSR